MENATKALLIAAAVLVVILLIAFGMNVFKQASEAGDASGISSELSSGITQSTGSVNTIIKDIIPNN